MNTYRISTMSQGNTETVLRVYCDTMRIGVLNDAATQLPPLSVKQDFSNGGYTSVTRIIGKLVEGYALGGSTDNEGGTLRVLERLHARNGNVNGCHVDIPAASVAAIIGNHTTEPADSCPCEILGNIHLKVVC